MSEEAERGKGDAPGANARPGESSMSQRVAMLISTVLTVLIMMGGVGLTVRVMGTGARVPAAAPPTADAEAGAPDSALDREARGRIEAANAALAATAQQIAALTAKIERSEAQNAELRERERVYEARLAEARQRLEAQRAAPVSATSPAPSRSLTIALAPATPAVVAQAPEVGSSEAGAADVTAPPPAAPVAEGAAGASPPMPTEAAAPTTPSESSTETAPSEAPGAQTASIGPPVPADPPASPTDPPVPVAKPRAAPAPSSPAHAPANTGIAAAAPTTSAASVASAPPPPAPPIAPRPPTPQSSPAQRIVPLISAATSQAAASIQQAITQGRRTPANVPQLPITIRGREHGGNGLPFMPGQR